MTCADPDLELAVYACFADVLLFVPATRRPPREAETLFGPLVHMGSVAARADEPHWDAIRAQIDRHLFATVPRPLGELLAGWAPQAVAPDAGAA